MKLKTLCLTERRNRLAIGVMLSFFCIHCSLPSFASAAAGSKPGGAETFAFPQVNVASTANASKPARDHCYARLPLSFEANEGQTDSEVKFFARGRGYTLFLTSTQSVLCLRRAATDALEPGTEGIADTQAAIRRTRRESRVGHARKGRQAPLAPAVLRMNLLGANSQPGVEPVDPLPGTANYFIGADPKRWRTGVSTCGKVLYREIYPGIDL